MSSKNTSVLGALALVVHLFLGIPLLIALVVILLTADLSSIDEKVHVSGVVTNFEHKHRIKSGPYTNLWVKSELGNNQHFITLSKDDRKYIKSGMHVDLWFNLGDTKIDQLKSGDREIRLYDLQRRMNIFYTLLLIEIILAASFVWVYVYPKKDE